MTRSPVLFALCLGLLPLAAQACPGGGDDEQSASAPGYGEVGLDEVARLVDSRGATIVDANRDDRYAQGHIPGALHVRRDDKGALAGDPLPADKATKLVFYCYSEKCQASHMAAQSAVDQGYAQVFVFPAGIMGWEKAGKPTEKTAAAPKAAPKPGKA